MVSVGVWMTELGLALLVDPDLLDRLRFAAGQVVITPVLGSELVSNPTFATWVVDVPGGWTLYNQTKPDPEVTERNPDQGHADTKTTGGAANLYATAAVFGVYQSGILTANQWYCIVETVSKWVVGSLVVYVGSLVNISIATEVTRTFTARADGADFWAGYMGGPVDMTIDSVSVKLLSGLDRLFTHAVAFGDFSVGLTIPTAFYQGGVTLNYQDASNYTRAYFDRLDAKVHLIKVVAGVTTEIGSWAVTYAAGATLIARRHKNGTLDVIYNGATLASGLTATGLAGLHAGPFLTNAAGVTINSYNWDAETTT